MFPSGQEKYPPNRNNKPLIISLTVISTTSADGVRHAANFVHSGGVLHVANPLRNKSFCSRTAFRRCDRFIFSVTIEIGIRKVKWNETITLKIFNLSTPLNGISSFHQAIVQLRAQYTNSSKYVLITKLLHYRTAFSLSPSERSVTLLCGIPIAVSLFTFISLFFHLTAPHLSPLSLRDSALPPNPHSITIC